MAAPNQPTGIKTETSSRSIIITWVENDEPDIKGYNIYNSMTSGGGISGYVKINPELLITPLRTENIVLSSSEAIINTPGVRTTTIVENVDPTRIFGFTHDNLLENKRQYYVITAVNNTNEESVYSIEVSSVPLNISTDLVNFPIRSSDEVARSIIARIQDRNKNVDVKPGTVTRDIHIDPQAAEFGNLFVQIDFLQRSQSFISLLDLDDPNDTGESIPVAESAYKTTLKSAYGIQSDAELQDLIDFAFDKLAGNYNVIRKGAEPSIGEVIFYTSTAPLANITIPVGTIVSTSATQSQGSINFQTTSEALIIASSISSYFNNAAQRYEIKVPVQSVDSGSITNVSSGTIINSNFQLMQVTNNKPTQGGIDSESNLDLATRGQLAFTSLDLGRLEGYKKTAIETHGVTDVLVVDAGHPLMQRDYDDVRKKHVHGKVDIYFKGSRILTESDTFGFKYKKIKGDLFNVTDATLAVNQRFTLTNSVLTSSTPAFMVQEVYNVSQAQAYDLLGNCDLYNNLISIPKTQYTLDLVNGDITFHSGLSLGDSITADYKYKQSITSEPLIVTALGGENLFTTVSSPIAETTDVISLLRVVNSDVVTTVLTRDVDYTIDNSNGDILLLNGGGSIFIGGGLTAGDSLVIDYDRIHTVAGETVLSSASLGQTTASLVNENILESVIIESDGVTINLDQNNTKNASIGMAVGDIIRVTYYYRDADPIYMTSQPVNSIISVIDSSNVALAPEVNYKFNDINDLLLEGNSVNATKNISIIYDSTTPAILSGRLTRNQETMNLISTEKREFDKKGVDIDTVVVRNEAGTVTYTPSIDYIVADPEAATGNGTITRTSSSSITSGQAVVVEYKHGELITVNYDVNSLIGIIQNNVKTDRHITADVLVKQANEIGVDLEFSIRLTKNSFAPTVKNAIMTRIGNALGNSKMGQRISQSDIVSIIDTTPGVDYVILPLLKMAAADGTHIVNEQILGAAWSVVTVGVATSYKTTAGILAHTTSGNASNQNYFWRVSQDDINLTLVETAAEVALGVGRAFIDSDGAVYVSTFENDDPSARKITVGYNVFNEIGSKDLAISDLDYLSLNSITIHIV